jgi:two-component system cell cycle response regulator DivK
VGLIVQARNQTVLLVEDNDDNRIIYSTYLTYSGFRVIEAADGEQGIALARAEQPDVVLMDISIPLVDGWEATRRLKADPATAHIPVIALTAHALAGDRERAFEVGSDGYLPKPVEPRAVAEAVERILEPR